MSRQLTLARVFSIMSSALGVAIMLAAALALVIALAGSALADETKPMTELDALRLGRLILQQQVLEQRHRAEKAEAQVEWSRRAAETQQLVGEAATRAGLDPKTWHADPATKTWRKATP